MLGVNSKVSIGDTNNRELLGLVNNLEIDLNTINKAKADLLRLRPT